MKKIINAHYTGSNILYYYKNNNKNNVDIVKIYNMTQIWHENVGNSIKRLCNDKFDQVLLELNINNLKINKCENVAIIEFLQKVYNEKIDLMKLHFEYSENGKGFDEAKKDFDTKILL